MSVKLLLDENLSPAAAVALIADGVDAYHMAQFKAKTSTTAHIAIAPVIVLNIPVLGTKMYPFACVRAP